MNGIFAQHISLNLLYLFEDSLFILVIILVEFIAVGFDSVSDKIKNFVRHVSFNDAHGDLFIVSIGYLSDDGVETFEVLD